MGLGDWFRNLFGWGSDRTIQRTQREIVLREDEFHSIHRRLRALDNKRSELLSLLHDTTRVKNEDDARAIAQSLVLLDVDEKPLRSQWDRVGMELTELRSSLATATTAATQSQWYSQRRLLERIEQLVRERALAEEGLAQAEKRFGTVLTAAGDAIEAARASGQTGSVSPESYLAVWRQSTRQAASEAQQREPPSPS